MDLDKKAKTQQHSGSKLKKLIEKSGLTIKEILDKSGISRGTLYNFFDYEDIPRKKLLPLLEVLQVDADEFYFVKNYANDDGNTYGLKAENEALRRELELLKQQLEAKEEIIQLLKNKTE